MLKMAREFRDKYICDNCRTEAEEDDAECDSLMLAAFAEKVIERCAQIAEAAKYEDTTGCDVASGHNGAADEIAAAIRSMGDAK